MNIYKLNFNANKYGGLYIPESEESKYFHYKKNYFSRCNSPITQWYGLKMEVENQSKLCDISTLPIQLIFSEKAIEILNNLIVKDVEIWKLEIDTVDNYYLVNVLSCPKDILDFKRSKFSYFKDGSISDILEYKFFIEKISSYHIFKLPFGSNDYYISESFKKIVESNHLSGLQFFPKGHKWCNLIWENNNISLI